LTSVGVNTRRGKCHHQHHGGGTQRTCWRFPRYQRRADRLRLPAAAKTSARQFLPSADATSPYLPPGWLASYP